MQLFKMIKVSDLSKICRICLEITNSGIFINNVEILDMLKSCTPIKFLDDSKFPSKLCDSCLKSLEKVLAFFALCENSNSELYKIIYECKENVPEGKVENKNMNIKEGVSIKAEDLILKYESIEENGNGDNSLETNNSLEANDNYDEQNENVENIDNPDISDKFDDKSSDLDFSNLQTEEGENGEILNVNNEQIFDKITELQLKVFKEGKLNQPRNNYQERLQKVQKSDKCDTETKTCKICNKQLINIHSLARHMELHESDRPIIATCEVCCKPFYDTGYLKRHMQRHNGETKYGCEHCSKPFYELNALAKHIKRRHKNVKPIPCDLCQKQFWVQLQMETHRRLHSSELKCEKCDKYFASMDHLRRHKITHIDTKQFSCLLCDKSFKHESYLLAHHKRIHENRLRRYVCNICGKAVPYMKRHLLKFHSTERPHKCDLCPKTYQLADELKNHIKKIHTEGGQTPKKFLCTICGLPCNSRADLEKHNRIHTGERPYPCSLCEKNFRTKTHLNLHFQRHTGQKSHVCTMCDKAFYTVQQLKNHKRTHTGERPYVCPYCGKTFSHSSAKYNHMKMHRLAQNKADQSEQQQQLVNDNNYSQDYKNQMLMQTMEPTTVFPKSECFNNEQPLI